MKLMIPNKHKSVNGVPDGKSVKLFDTTLRDGTQGENVSFSVEGKLQVAEKLDDFGIDYIEGGWPGSNPKDIEFFSRVRDKHFKHARIVAFGSTRHKSNPVEEDPNLRTILEAETPAVSIFGKTSVFHVETALNTTLETNLKMINDSIAYVKANGREVIYDAEHFFDGYKENPDYALQTILSAEKGGADVIVLCDTNGGSLPEEIAKITKAIKSKTKSELGIHVHNDSELAVANTITAVNNGATHVQGTINGYGERCGNANLCSIIPNLQFKLGYKCVDDSKINQLTGLSRYVSEIANLHHHNNYAYVGKSAFAHKGGIHVSAVMKNQQTYEHINPGKVGNRQRVIVSELSGKSNLLYKADELNIDLTKYKDKVPNIVEGLKLKEYQGYLYEAAEGSLELLVKKHTGEWKDFFELSGFRILIEKDQSGTHRSEATIRIKVDGRTEHIAAEGSGPVHALDKALRKALKEFYPNIEEMKLSDYKVRVLNNKDGTAAKVRVLIDFTAAGISWSTVGVSENIIEASWQALLDGCYYYLHKMEAPQEKISFV